MMKKLKILLYYTINAITLTSCLSTKKLIKNDSFLENNISALNGIYENVAVTASDVVKSERSLYLLFFNNNHYDKNNEGQIKIKAVSDRKIQIDYIVEDEIRKSQKFKGKIKNNFFVIERKWKLLGLPPILGFYYESKIAIGLSEDDLLYIRKGTYDIGGLIFFVAGYEEYESWLFKKIRN
jgi:hypothetical protein